MWLRLFFNGEGKRSLAKYESEDCRLGTFGNVCSRGFQSKYDYAAECLCAANAGNGLKTRGYFSEWVWQKDE